MRMNDGVVGGCSSMPMHVFVFHIQPPQPFFAQCMLAASQGYKIARQFTTLRLPNGAMQNGQQANSIVCGLG
jgi:hypothetical protein